VSSAGGEGHAEEAGYLIEDPPAVRPFFPRHHDRGARPHGVHLRHDGAAGLGDIEAQTRQVCENLKAAIEEAGGGMDDICRVDVYVRNMEHFDAIHKVRREYFKPPAPASTMVEICKMTSPDYLIEINAIAVIAD
jgi:2-iminobutanoate/2-iminopropanoate deaminase